MKIGQIRILFILLVALAFFKIYQHNLIVKLTYEPQRLLRHKKSLEPQRNELYIVILKLRAMLLNALGLLDVIVRGIKGSGYVRA